MCLCTISPQVINKYSHHIGLFPSWEIYDICPLIVPSHDGVVIPFMSLFDYLSFNLMAQHISFCEKKLESQKYQKRMHGAPSPLLKKLLCTNYPK